MKLFKLHKQSFEKIEKNSLHSNKQFLYADYIIDSNTHR